MPVSFNTKPMVVKDDTYDIPETGQFSIENLSANAWWTFCTKAEFQIIPQTPTDPESFGAIAYDETGDAATTSSSRVSSNSDWTVLDSKLAIQNFRAINLMGSGNKIRIRFYSTYY